MAQSLPKDKQPGSPGRQGGSGKVPPPAAGAPGFLAAAFRGGGPENQILHASSAAAMLDEIGIARDQDARKPMPPKQPTQGVLVVGMGDEDRGDGGVGLHLVRCLAQLDWPGSVVFRAVDESIPARAREFARVILLDAINGPEPPGSLYQADAEELLDQSIGGAGSGLCLLGMLPKDVLKRVAVFGVQPATTEWGSALSPEVIATMPAVVSYIRAYILQVAAELRRLN